jgi:polyvinyl alcohol dehydrogenase (cytochrome)
LALGSAQWNGWGRDLDGTRYQPEPAIRAADVPKLALKWAFGYQGSAVAGQPTVVDGRLFVLSAMGRVYSLDSKTGCTYWTFDAQGGAQTAISIGELGLPRNAAAPSQKGHASRRRHKLALAHLDILKAPSAAFFGDDSGAVYALDAQKGSLLWKAQVDAHPLARIVGTPTLYHDRLYVVVASGERHSAAQSTAVCCTFRGSVAALDMATGRVLWKTYAIAEEPRPAATNAAGVPAFGPAGVAIAASPVIDVKRGLLYVTTAGSTSADQPLADAVVALDSSDGRVRWVKQFSLQGATGSTGAADAPGVSGTAGVRGAAGATSANDAAAFLSAPILRTLANGKQVLLAGQKSGIVYGLDPDRGGELLWQTKVAEGVAAGGIEWGSAADHRSLYVPLSGLTAEPENMYGSLTALDMKTGAKRWYTPAPTPSCTWGEHACSHAQAQAVTVIPGVAFSGSMDGHLRAYSTIDGKIVWDFETAKDFATINGVKASGGSLDQGGATIVNGVVYINSGYAQRIGQPGNVLLAFSVDGK